MIGFQNKTFSLLWKGKRDGYAASTFHRLCDGKPNTLTVSSTLGAGYAYSIFGGYTAVPWSSPSSSQFHSDPKAFLFTLQNKQNTPLKMKVKQNGEMAVCHNSGSGPIFGKDDLHISDNSNANENSKTDNNQTSIYDYPGFDLHDNYIDLGSTMRDTVNFQASNIEVYQII